MIDWSTTNGIDLHSSPDELLEVIERGRLTIAAEDLQQSLGNRLHACIADVIRSYELAPSAAHQIAANIGWVAALTSNYDSLFEGAYALEHGGTLPPTYTMRGIGPALDSLRKGKFFVCKLHGDLNDPASIVLGDRDYSRLLYLSPGYRSFLETIFATYTVLFIGFGGVDADLDDVTNRLSAVYERSVGRHFMLIADQTLTPLERRRLRLDKQLDCIPYIPDSSHSQVLEFLKNIADQTISSKPPLPTTATMPPRVFISATLNDKKYVDQVVKYLHSSGITGWYADNNVHAGDHLSRVISREIARSDALIVIVTRAASSSKWVTFEAERGLAANKRVIPVRVGDAQIPSALRGLVYVQMDEDGAIQESSLRQLRRSIFPHQAERG